VGGATLNFNFLSGPLDSRITFTRASTATFFNSAGVLTSASNDVARFDYNPATLAPLGLLIEESRTNLLLQSGWTGATSGSPGAAPTSWTLGFGTGTVTTVVSSTAGPIASAVRFDYDNTERVMFQQIINVTAGVQYAFSIYVEALSGAAAGDVLTVTAGTTTGTINTPVTNPSSAGRYTFLFTADGTGTVNLRVGAGTTAGVGATGSITLSRPQCEAGAFPTSYIPTTTTALTRAADVASVNTLTPWFNASAGTLFAEATSTGYVIDVNFPLIASIDDGTGNNRITLQQSGATTSLTLNVRTASIATTIADSGVDLSSIPRKIAGSYSGTSVVVSVNGNAAITGTSNGVPSGLTNMKLGSAVAGYLSGLNGHLRRVTFYPRALSAAELQAITA
jgi:hypothetical protein